MIVAIDFDGTCVTHEYPHVGKDVEGAVPVLRELVGEGHKLILYTMRDGKLLDAALEWFRKRDIPLYDVNRNRRQTEWTTSPKIHADVYIDDNALGCPLKYEEGVRKPYVDWERARKLLVEYGLLYE